MRAFAWTLALLAVCATALFAFARRPDLRVVAQLEGADDAGLSASLRSLSALMDAASAQGQPVDLEVVVTGAAARRLLRGTELAAGPVQTLQGQGAQFAVGRDTLAEDRLRDDDLPDGFSTVPSGLAEIARLQAERYGYVRP